MTAAGAVLDCEPNTRTYNDAGRARRLHIGRSQVIAFCWNLYLVQCALAQTVLSASEAGADLSPLLLREDRHSSVLCEMLQAKGKTTTEITNMREGLPKA